MPTEKYLRVFGITLVELFTALAVLAIILSFASAPLQRMSAYVDVDIAHDNISHMIRVARRSAANNRLPIVISISRKEGRIHMEANHSYQWRNLRLDPITPYSLPEGVNAVLDGDQTSIGFGEIGQALQVQQMQIFSEANPEYRVDLMIGGAAAPGSELIAATEPNGVQ